MFIHVTNISFQSENESDVWDDTALIEAYDNAVSNMKVSTTHLRFFYDERLNAKIHAIPKEYFTLQCLKQLLWIECDTM